jgi:hypothetical protein
MNYVIALGLDEASIRRIRPELSGVARKFSPHISLRGRFLLGPDKSRSELLRFIATETGYISKKSFKLGPLRSISNGLAWRELERNTDAQYLRSLHSRITESLVKRRLIGVDNTPASFQHHGYIPHLTIRWQHPENRKPATCSVFTSRCVEIVCASVEVYEYEKSPFISNVTRITAKLL